MKLRKSTIIIIIISWFFFLAFCALGLLGLMRMKEHQANKKEIFGKGAVHGTTNVTTATTTTQEEKSSVNDQVTEFMRNYYYGMNHHQNNRLSNMVEDKKALTKSLEQLGAYVQRYEQVNYLVRPGADEESWIVYVSYQLKIKNIDTLAPGMTPYYVVAKGDTFMIYNNEEHYTKVMKDARTKDLSQPEVKALVDDVNKKYELALKSDKELKNFLGNGNNQ